MEMKEKKKVVSFLSALVLCVGMMTLPVSAETVRQDGLEVTLTTDRAEYTGEEQIEAVLSVTNTNDTAVNNVSMETIIPDGYAAADGSVAELAADTLEAGETLTLTVTLEPVAEESGSGTDTGSGDAGGSGADGGGASVTGGDNVSGNDGGSGSGTDGNGSAGTGSEDDTTSDGSTGSSSDVSSTSAGSDVQTGDDTNVVVWVVLVALAAGTCCVIFIVRKKRGKQFLSLFLSLVMAGSVITAVSYQAEAAEDGDAGSVSVTETVTADGEEITIEGIVSYVLGTGEGSGEDDTFTPGLGEDAVQDTDFTAEDADPTFGSREEEIINIAELNGGEFPYNSLDDNGVPEFIYGKFSDKVIESAEDAIDALNDIHYIMGFQNAEQEFEEVYTETVDLGAETTYYRLQQVYQNIPVYGYQLIVSTDASGEIETLSGHYYPGIDISTDASVTVDEAKEIVADNFSETEMVSDGLYIYTEEAVSLCWKIRTYTNSYFVDAGTGSVVAVISEIEDDTVTGEGTSLSGKTVSFPVTLTDGAYTLEDYTRNIFIYDADYQDQMGDIVLENSNDAWDNHTEAITVYSNMITVYDYYANVLGRDGADNAHKNIFIAVKYRSDSNKEWSNAAFSGSYTNYTCIVIGDGDNYANCLDVLAHEFTHAVIDSVWGAEYLNESGALNESYSDIIGNLIEDGALYLHGEDKNSGAGRSFADPNAYDQPESTTDTAYLADYCYESGDHNNHNNCDNGGVHTNSGIVNHAAYLMDQNWPEDNHADELAALFYKSMFYLSPNSDFLDCRHAVLAAAQSMHLSEEKQVVIAEAFSDVGIEDNSSLWGIPADASVSVTGVVKDADTGDVIVDAKVSSIRTSWFGGIYSTVCYTDSSGNFEFLVGADEFTVTVEAEGYDSYSAVIDVTEAAGTEFRLGTVFLTREEPSGDEDDGITGYVGGTITDASTGEPLEDVTVKFRNGTDNQEGDYVQAVEGIDIELTTESSGHYYTAALPAGEYTLEATKDGYETAYLNVVSGFSEEYNEQDVEMQKIRGVLGCMGVVIDSETGDPVPGLTVELSSLDGTLYGSEITDDSGYFEISINYETGAYALSITGDGYETYTNFYLLTAGEGLVDAGTISMSPLKEESDPSDDGYTLIYTLEDLVAIGGQSGNYRLASDIDATGYSSGCLVGTITEDTVLDGDGYTIYVGGERGKTDLGLIGANYGTVKNLKVNGPISLTISSYLTYGGIVGTNRGLIENCSFDGEITISDNSDTDCYDVSIGGICGLNENGTISGCIMNGSMSLSLDGYLFYIGGICGRGTTDTVIEDCINYAPISADYTAYYEEVYVGYVGGICGYCDDWETNEIIHCLNTASIRATTNYGTTWVAGVCARSGASYECGNTGAMIYAGYGNHASYIQSYAYAVSHSLDSGYTVSNTILYDSSEGQRNPAAADNLQILSEEEILSMWE